MKMTREQAKTVLDLMLKTAHTTLCETEKDSIRTAVELLKEQKPVEPIPPTDESDLWRCGNCNHQLFRCKHQRYCEMCGRGVKWE